MSSAAVKLTCSEALDEAISASLAVPAGENPEEHGLRFTDSKIESSEVLSIVLELIVRGKMDFGAMNYPSIVKRCRAAAFLRKYGCEAALETMKLIARHEAITNAETPPFYIFMLAAATDDVELSMGGFALGDPWPTTENVLNQHLIPGIEHNALCSDLLGLWPTLNEGSKDLMWTEALWDEIPLDYMWAASKAWGDAWLSLLEVDHVENAGQLAMQRGNDNLKHFDYEEVDIVDAYEAAIKAIKTDSRRSISSGGPSNTTAWSSTNESFHDDVTARPSSSSRPDDDSVEVHPRWLQGDFLLVSSDGWRFCVRAEALRWAR